MSSKNEILPIHIMKTQTKIRKDGKEEKKTWKKRGRQEDRRREGRREEDKNQEAKIGRARER